MADRVVEAFAGFDPEAGSAVSDAEMEAAVAAAPTPDPEPDVEDDGTLDPGDDDDDDIFTRHDLPGGDWEPDQPIPAMTEPADDVKVPVVAQSVDTVPGVDAGLVDDEPVEDTAKERRRRYPLMMARVRKTISASSKESDRSSRLCSTPGTSPVSARLPPSPTMPSGKPISIRLQDASNVNSGGNKQPSCSARAGTERLRAVGAHRPSRKRCAVCGAQARNTRRSEGLDLLPHDPAGRSRIQGNYARHRSIRPHD